MNNTYLNIGQPRDEEHPALLLRVLLKELTALRVQFLLSGKGVRDRKYSEKEVMKLIQK